MTTTTRPLSIRLAALLAAAIPTASPASVIHTDPAVIDRDIERFTGMPIGVEGGAARPVDRRLRLALCNAPLSLGWHGTRRDTVRVECPDHGGWRIFVAVTASRAESAGSPRARVIARGDAVSIVVRGMGFSVSQTGEAMDAGGIDEWIRVKPPGGADPIRARIQRPGLVIITL